MDIGFGVIYIKHNAIISTVNSFAIITKCEFQYSYRVLFFNNVVNMQFGGTL